MSSKSNKRKVDIVGFTESTRPSKRRRLADYSSQTNGMNQINYDQSIMIKGIKSMTLAPNHEEKNTYFSIPTLNETSNIQQEDAQTLINKLNQTKSIFQQYSQDTNDIACKAKGEVRKQFQKAMEALKHREQTLSEKVFVVL